jgi:hypothetical protein
MENQVDGINSEGGKDVLLISRGTNTNIKAISYPQNLQQSLLTLASALTVIAT